MAGSVKGELKFFPLYPINIEKNYLGPTLQANDFVYLFPSLSVNLVNIS